MRRQLGIAVLSCIEEDGTLHTASGFDSMTGIGSPGPGCWQR